MNYLFIKFDHFKAYCKKSYPTDSASSTRGLLVKKRNANWLQTFTIKNSIRDNVFIADSGIVDSGGGSVVSGCGGGGVGSGVVISLSVFFKAILIGLISARVVSVVVVTCGTYC